MEIQVHSGALGVGFWWVLLDFVWFSWLLAGSDGLWDNSSKGDFREFQGNAGRARRNLGR
jgi:hypothetical protein